MTIKLPQPIANYYKADMSDGAAFAACFTEDAVVFDEKKTHRGRDEIRQWKTDSAKKYSYTVEPFALEERDGKTVVTAHVAGTFPGSPIDLRYFFGLQNDKVNSLEIKV